MLLIENIIIGIYNNNNNNNFDGINVMIGFHRQTIIQFIPMTLLKSLSYLIYNKNKLFIISILFCSIDILIQLLT